MRDNPQNKETTMDYDIEVKKMIPPIGLNKYYAVFMYYKNGLAIINNEIGEVYGKTKEEAHKRMAAKAQNWIRNNKG